MADGEAATIKKFIRKYEFNNGESISNASTITHLFTEKNKKNKNYIINCVDSLKINEYDLKGKWEYGCKIFHIFKFLGKGKFLCLRHGNDDDPKTQSFLDENDIEYNDENDCKRKENNNSEEKEINFDNEKKNKRGSYCSVCDEFDNEIKTICTICNSYAHINCCEDNICINCKLLNE